MFSSSEIKRFHRKKGTLAREVPLLAGKPHGVEVYYREDGNGRSDDMDTNAALMQFLQRCNIRLIGAYEQILL